MKKLLKSEIYGSVDSTHRALFMGKVKHFDYKKKKKNPAKTQTCVWEVQNALPKRTIIGDFNEVLSVNEKEGGADRLSR